MQVLNNETKTRTITFTEDDLLTLTVFMRKGAELWQEETGQDVDEELAMAREFSRLNFELLRERLEEEEKSK